MRSELSWRPPCDGWVKANSYATVIGCGGFAYSGSVIRNAVGEWIFDFSVLVDELCAALDVLCHAWRLGFRKVELEVDNFSACKILVGDLKALFNSSLVIRIREMLSKPREMHVTHVFCEMNSVVDGLVRMTKGKEIGEWVYSSPPWEVRSMLTADMRSL
ncbi:hypothetical protein GQ457_11G029410 [Hibiscus cannabinus]